MTSLLSKLFGTATPHVRRTTRRARLGVENLDGRIMPMTMVELQVIVGPPPPAPRPATPPGAGMPAGGKVEMPALGQDAGRAYGWIN